MDRRLVCAAEDLVSGYWGCGKTHAHCGCLRGTTISLRTLTHQKVAQGLRLVIGGNPVAAVLQPLYRIGTQETALVGLEAFKEKIT